MLEIRNLDVCHGSLQVVWDVSLEVREGEIVTLLGPNGSGKTTLVETIIGLNRTAKGRILFNGEEILGLHPYEIVRKGLSLVPEKRALFPKMSVAENLSLGGYLEREGTWNAGRVFEMFPVLGERKDQLAGTLSGGEQQMLAIGRSLMMEPTLLILDEPSLGLSPIFVKNVLAAVAGLNRQGLTILLLEQNVKQALQISHRGYVLENGKISFSGLSDDLLKSPEIQAAYLGL